MNNISQEKYEFALSRIEALLPIVTDETPANDVNAVELALMSDIVIEYEKEHYPIAKPTVAELIKLSLEQYGLTQKTLAAMVGVSPSRINDYVSGKAEPTLRIAHSLCHTLHISPSAMLGF
jgi:HTH-type transcriptional regulator/antitoxin HigA